MEENFNKLILKNNSSILKKKETINSMKNYRYHKNSNDNKQSSHKKSSINYQNLAKSEKNKYYFQSYIKQYRISNLNMSHNNIRRFPKTPKNFLFRILPCLPLSLHPI